ncbi:conserved hypothetical protein [Leishmania braziliensis MHOM/BR/75/M2904]|uniref:Nodulin-like domain-containing protein n=2 Tax=Leishmania braziliensis TaxID=5660 RepID=A4HHG4_LEIBR|nr:conserved hypothetical protein [Leishmania braziliensis MHOM/BR/75/M2904]CAJ2476578.1 unnamed protein product [Leishmania braziliensis]CAM40017.1 conserved hypothetical protein [Leishmania braziliensis MHOM/BR/75/M2904]SYZ67682.1 Nodulin-like/Major_Facilitator_Superfamily [Leishmania braziliensis MHOM/BR/75/M2904]
MITEENYCISEISRFLILLGGLCASVCISTMYGFNILSNKMMELFNLSSSDLTTITTVGTVVGFATFPCGVWLDYAGPVPILIFATTLTTLGVLLYALAFNGNIKGSVTTLAVFCAIMNLGCSSFDTGSLMAVLGSFPLTKGPVVAIMKTFTGLGASILALINYSFFRNSDAHYMFFMAGLIVFMGIVAIVFIRFPPYHILDGEKTRVPQQVQARRRLTERAYLTQYPPMTRFYLGFGIIVSLVVYLTAQSFSVAYANPSDSARMGNTVAIIVLVLSLGLMAAPFPFLGGMDKEASKEYPNYPQDAGIGFENESDKRLLKPAADNTTQAENTPANVYESQKPCDERADASRPEACWRTASQVIVVAEKVVVEKKLPRNNYYDQDPKYHTTFWQSLKQPDIWLCCWNALATWGCGMVVAFNSAQIYRALANDVYESKVNTMYSAIISVASALGRLTMGVLEFILSHQPSEMRPVITIAYPVSSICMVIGLIFLLALPLESKAIVIGFFFSSFGNGFSWACTALTVHSVFAKDIGKHYNFMYVGAFIAVIALNRFGYGENYDRQAKLNRDADLAAGRTPIYPRCAGKKCVANSMVILLCVNATAIVGSTWFHLRYRRFVLKRRVECTVELENCRLDVQQAENVQPGLNSVNMCSETH